MLFCIVKKNSTRLNTHFQQMWVNCQEYLRGGIETTPADVKFPETRQHEVDLNDIYIYIHTHTSKYLYV
jgi:hypothetical protein